MYAQKRLRKTFLIRCWILIAAITAWAAPLAAVDLAQVDRTIATEPAYQTKSPKYCLIVFGVEAKARMWLIVDGDMLHVDRNGKGDFASYSGPGWHLGDIVQAGAEYHDFKVIRNTAGRFYIRCKGATGRYCWSAGTTKERLDFGETPEKAPILHFGGPLSMRAHLSGNRKYFVRGRESSLEVFAGTPGLGEGTFTSVYGSRFTKTATIRFPAEDGSSTGPKLKFEIVGC